MEHALEVDPLDTHALNGLGVVLEELGCPEEARDHYWSAVAIDPRRIQSWGNLARLAELEGDASVTASTCEQVLDLDPWQVEYRERYVWALLVLGREEEAQEQLEIVLSQAPEATRNWARYARLLLMRGDATPAQEAIDATRGLDASWPELDELQDEANRQRGER